jgi:hypothetical protein
MPELISKASSMNASASSIPRRKWIIRTVLFSLIASISFPIVDNWVDAFAPRNQFGSDLLLLGTLSYSFVISSLIMLPIALIVVFLVQRGLFERHRDSVIRIHLLVRTIITWLLIFIFGLFLMIGV